jgi:pimeloyl-ACP methyl ester carboxylesterase
MILLYILVGVLTAYGLVTLLLSYVVQQLPRNPVSDRPDWGQVMDASITASDGGYLEVWRIEPDAASIGIIVFAHGWGRNRDRMIARARIFASWGFTAVVHSARDHGGSSSRRCMNALKMAEDIEAVLAWIDEPVILYGHSAGAAAAIIAAGRNPQYVRLLFLEACYAHTKAALQSLYSWVNRFFGMLFGPMILFWMDLFYKKQLDVLSPARIAPGLCMPVMLIHGEQDRRFPLKFARELYDSFAAGQAEFYIAGGVGHSDSSQTPGYRPAVGSFLNRNGYDLGIQKNNEHRTPNVQHRTSNE